MRLTAIFGMARNKPEQTVPSITEPAPGAPPSGSESEQLAEILARHLGPVRGDSGFEMPAKTPVPPALIASEAKAFGWTLPESRRAEAQLLADEWQTGVEEISSAGRDRVRAAFEAHQKDVAEGALAGQPVADAWTRADIEADFAKRRAALKRACLERSQKAGALLAEIVGPLVEHLRRRAEETARDEFRAHAKAGVAYAPSELVKALSSAAGHLEWSVAKFNGPGAGLGYNPRAMFASVGIEL